MKFKKSLSILISFLTLFVFGTNSANAARLYFDVPEAISYEESFLVPLRLDVEGECINAIEATLTYSSDTLVAVDFSRGQSIFSLWPEPPIIEGGSATVSFSGGIPGGYCGPVAGDRAGTNVIGDLVLRTLPNEGRFEATLEGILGFAGEPQILLHDGFGTPAPVTAERAVFAIRELGELPQDRWQELLDADDVLPEAFTVFLHADPSIFGGAPYVTFSTTDKQSGIDYYEVREGGATWTKWEAGEPYRLQETGADSSVVVRAYDKAGNVRESVLDRDSNAVPIIDQSLTRLEAMLLAGIAIAFAVLLFALAWAIRRRKTLRDATL